ncbi:hypothetical protein V8E52_009165 [Russula decolorans]
MLCTSCSSALCAVSLCHAVTSMPPKQKKHSQDSCLNLHHGLLTRFENSLPFLFFNEDELSLTRLWHALGSWSHCLFVGG